jgi:ribosomal protein S18 acetylase RimI-like enzyme
MTDLRFSYATPADVPRLATLIELAYRGSDAATGWTNETDILEGPRSSPEEVERLVRDPDSRFVLAHDGDRLIGSALLKQQGEGAYFGMFAIDPRLQQQGLGKSVISRCEAAARELWNAKYLELTVISLRDELIGWYQRRGFRLTGERHPFPFDVATGALRTDFDLVVLQKPL